jgi:hypothetical protein
MLRRDLLKRGDLLAGASSLLRPQLLADMWEGYSLGTPQVTNRLNQGPFGIISSRDNPTPASSARLPSSCRRAWTGSRSS